MDCIHFSILVVNCSVVLQTVNHQGKLNHTGAVCTTEGVPTCAKVMAVEPECSLPRGLQLCEQWPSSMSTCKPLPVTQEPTEQMQH